MDECEINFQQDDNHTCEICEKDFFTKLNLDLHIKHFHITKPKLKCSQCDEVFSMKIHLQRHENSVHVAKPETFSCDVCEKTFSGKVYLQNHF